MIAARRILLTGASGFLGQHTRPVLEARYGAENITAVSSRDYDLMDRAAVDRMFEDLRPDVVVLPKAASAEDVRQVIELLPAGIGLEVQIESARGGP